MSRKYNTLFILPASMSDEEIEKAMKTVHESVAKLNGSASAPQILGKRPFARPLQKHETGLYVKMQIELEPGSIDALIARFKLNEDLFRVQILRDEEEAAPAAAPTVPAETETDNG